MQYLVAVSDGAVVRLESVPEKIRKASAINGNNDNSFLEANFASAKKLCLDNFTRKYLVSYLRKNKGNVSGTAKQINVCRASLQRMIKRFAITKTELA
jgi:transcriptional regulator of acetoin/glycerol metabolism